MVSSLPGQLASNQARNGGGHIILHVMEALAQVACGPCGPPGIFTGWLSMLAPKAEAGSPALLTQSARQASCRGHAVEPRHHIRAQLLPPPSEGLWRPQGDAGDHNEKARGDAKHEGLKPPRSAACFLHHGPALLARRRYRPAYMFGRQSVGAHA